MFAHGTKIREIHHGNWSGMAIHTSITAGYRKREKKMVKSKYVFSKVVTFLETFPQSSAVRYGEKNQKNLILAFDTNNNYKFLLNNIILTYYEYFLFDYCSWNFCPNMCNCIRCALRM